MLQKLQWCWMAVSVDTVFAGVAAAGGQLACLLSMPTQLFQTRTELSATACVQYCKVPGTGTAIGTAIPTEAVAACTCTCTAVSPSLYLLPQGMHEKDAKRWMAGRAMLALVMVPRGVLERHNLLTDRKDGLVNSTVGGLVWLMDGGRGTVDIVSRGLDRLTCVPAWFATSVHRASVHRALCVQCRHNCS